MEELTTAQKFLLWLTSAGGLGVAVTFIVGQIKKLWPELEGWAALGITLGVAILLGGGATLALQLGWFEYVEPYWSVIVAIATVVGGFATSQLLYHKAPASGNGQ